MSTNLPVLFASAAVAAPLLAIVLILVYYYLLRLVVTRLKPPGQRRVFCPSSFALGMAFQFMQVYHRPSMAYVLEVKQEDQAEKDKEGGPESLIKQFHRQLQRIRRGDPVKRLVLRI